jgi:hypothetical protein
MFSIHRTLLSAEKIRPHKFRSVDGPLNTPLRGKSSSSQHREHPHHRVPCKRRIDHFIRCCSIHDTMLFSGVSPPLHFKSAVSASSVVKAASTSHWRNTKTHKAARVAIDRWISMSTVIKSPVPACFQILFHLATRTVDLTSS